MTNNDIKRDIEIIDMALYALGNIVQNPIYDSGHSKFEYKYSTIKPLIERVATFIDSKESSVTDNEKRMKFVKEQLSQLKGDIKNCIVIERYPLVKHVGLGVIDAKEHLLGHVDAIEYLLELEVK